MNTKECSFCKTQQPLSNFHKRTFKSGKVGTQSTCKNCVNERRRKYHKPHTSIRLKLGLTQEQVDAIIAPQKCDVCGAGPDSKLCIDHDHTTKKVRGLLCHKCNTALGLLNDDEATVRKLEQYLVQSRQQE